MKTKAKAKPKKKNPADTTMRNINALKKRVAKMESLIDALYEYVIGMKK
jgi:hypothetical protein